MQLKIKTDNVTVHYGNKLAIDNINLDIYKNYVTALIGPSGCGKSTFLRCLNRMNDTIDICKVTGKILFDQVDLNNQELDVVMLRTKIGMVFQKPNPFPKSIFDNVAYGLRIHKIAQNKAELNDIVASWSL
mgnify:FL=1